MLRPVVRQLLSHGITYPIFDQVVRGLYVEVAEGDFALPHKRQTDSRISLVTGLNRKEIARLRRQPASDEPPPLEQSLTARVIGRWMAGPPYADRRGRAHRLPYEDDRASVATFARLVRDAGADVPVRSVLDELLRAGAAKLEPSGNVELCREAHVPARDDAGKLALLGSDPGELFSSIVHNIERPEAPWLQRKVAYDNIGEDALADLREQAKQQGEEFVRKANALLAARDRDRNPAAPGGRRARVVLGAYYFEEPVVTAESPSPADPGPRLPGRITARSRGTRTRRPTE